MIADVQYADRDDEDAHFRRYRSSLQLTQSAMLHFREREIDILMNLGDTVDGWNRKQQQQVSALTKVLHVFEESGAAAIYHVVGNNEVNNFSRGDNSILPFRTPLNWIREPYYSFSPCENWLVVVLDTYQQSLQGGATDQDREAAKQWLRQNPNYENLFDSDDWTRESGVNPLAGLPNSDDKRRRLLADNGGVGLVQLKWLEETLERATVKKQRVVVFGHNPVHLSACHDVASVPFDHVEVLDVLNRFNQVVVAYLAGHDHMGAYARRSNIHHVTVPSPLEADPETGPRFVELEFDHNSLKLTGCGTVFVCPGDRLEFLGDLWVGWERGGKGARDIRKGHTTIDLSDGLVLL